MMRKVARFIRNGTVIDQKKEPFIEFEKHSFSQEGEDLILNDLFLEKDKGFYIDIGAHHPARFSNTMFFYKKGWSGINIDAMPGSMISFKQFRSRDINIELGVSEKEDELDFYIFDEPALNGFNSQVAQERDRITEYKIIKTQKVKTMPLEKILSNYIPDDIESIDFLSIDVEGLDFEVLKSNDWNKYKPLYVLVEDTKNALFHDILSSEIYEYMSRKGYDIIAKTKRTHIYKYIKD